MAGLADLVAATGLRWRAEDWIRAGLIDAGYSPGRGRGLGRVGRIWPDAQVVLARELSKRRKACDGIRPLADFIVGRWLLHDPAIPTRQALRALRTWSWPTRFGSRRVSRQLAHELLRDFPEPARAALHSQLALALEHGRALDGEIEIPFLDAPRLTREQVVAGEALPLVIGEQREKSLVGEELAAHEAEMRVHAEDRFRRHPERIGRKVGERLAERSPVHPRLIHDIAAVTRALAFLDMTGESDLGQVRQSILLEQARQSILPLRSGEPLPGGAFAVLRELGRYRPAREGATAYFATCERLYSLNS